MTRASMMGLALLAALAGCRGTVGEVDRPWRAGDLPPGACEAAPPPPELHRLSGEQYRHTVRDLVGGPLGAELAAAATFPETSIEAGFRSDASANTVNEVESNLMEDNAATLAALVTADPTRNIPLLMPCAENATDAEIDGCIDGFIDAFGTRAYRRPLTDGERTLVRGLYDATRGQGAQVALASVLEFFFQAPSLLYRVERGESDVEGVENQRWLGDYEVASRLSYFLWGSMPDDALFAAAADGRLGDAEGVEAEARRMIEDPRAIDALTAFHRDLFRTYRLESIGVEDPAWNGEVQDAMVREGRAYLEAAIARDALTFYELFGSNIYVVDPALTEIYGVDAPGEVEVPNRHGLLGLPSVLTALAHEHGKNPTVMRGVYVVRNVLCGSLPPFPDSVDVAEVLASASDAATARERLMPTQERSDCSFCHETINPPGFALESYDYMGRFRTEEDGNPIDASGTVQLGARAHEYADGADFLDLIANSATAEACYARQWYRFAIGRAETDADACEVDRLSDAFATSGGDVRELLVQIAASDRFRTRVIEESQP